MDLQNLAHAAAARHPALRLLVLFGSRARADARPGSDWDFAFVAAPGLDPTSLQSDLEATCGAGKVDLIDLAVATGLLRYRVARDGKVLFDAGGAWDAFWWDAVSFWCDVEPVLERSYGAVLQGRSP